MDEITEIDEFEADRLDAVGQPANGTSWLLLKAQDEGDEDDDDVACPTCGGDGKIKGGNVTCPDCGGKGKISPAKAESMKKDAKALHEGVTADGEDEAAKAKLSSAEINDLPDSAFAYIEPGGKKDDEGKTVPRSKRHFPIHDEAHVRNALSRAPQSPFGDKAMPKIRAAAKKFGIEVSKEAEVTVAKDGSVASMANQGAGSSDSDEPGSAAWEQADSDAARQVATGLASLRSKVDGLTDREMAEVMAGLADDQRDVFDLQTACDAIDFALGVVAGFSFREAQESADAGSGSVAKAGKRLSAATTSKIKQALDALHNLLGDGGVGDQQIGDPDVATSNQEDIYKMDLTPAELEERVADVVAKAIKKDRKQRKAKRQDRKAQKLAKAEAKATSTHAVSDTVAPTTEAEGQRTTAVDGKAAPETSSEGVHTDAVTEDCAPTTSAVTKAESEDTTTGEAGTPEELQKKLASLEERLEAFEAQPARGFVQNAAGIAALRGAVPGDGEIASLQKALDEATDPREKERIASELSFKKLRAMYSGAV